MLKKGYSDLASKLLLSVKSLFTQYVATRQVDILSKETDGKKNNTNIKRKRKRQAAPCNSQDSSESDSLSTPASQSPPRSDDEEEKPQFAHAIQSNKRPRILGRRFKVGTRVAKHFPGEGWFDGEITKIRWSNSQLQYVYMVKYEEGKKEEMTELQISNVAELEEQDETLYSYEQFNKLWESLNPESVEKSALVRRANTCVKEHESGVQYNAQYGRMLPGSTDMIFQILQLQRNDLFLDIGHGIGNACLQAAYTVGCEARGIEVVKDRYEIGLRFQEALEELAYQQDVNDGKMRLVGKVKFLHGDLSDPVHHNWLAKANKIFVNNFNGVFAERSARFTTEWHLDHYIAGKFASMAEGSVMVTLSDLQLGPTQSEANKWREENGLQPSSNASFFEVKKVLLGEAGQVFSWSTSCKTPAYAYVYKRVKQNPKLREAAMLCCNKDCEHAIAGTPIPATTINKEGRVVVGTCECKMSLRSNRRIAPVRFLDFVNSNDFL